MWAHRSWVGDVFAATTAAGSELGAYAEILNTVEGNTTFYALPQPATVAKWAGLVGPDFRFCLKVPRTITHDRRLRHAAVELAEFIERFAPIHHLMGPTMIQLPASFGAHDLDVLDGFLAALPTDLQWAVEVRDRAFFVGGSAERPLDDLLRSHRANRVILDSRALFAGPNNTPAERDAWERKPRLPVRPTATASSPVVRFIGQTDTEANPEFWQPWVTKMASWCNDGLTPYFFMHTPYNHHSPRLARRFHDAVATESDVVEALGPLVAPDRLFTDQAELQ